MLSSDWERELNRMLKAKGIPDDVRIRVLTVLLPTIEALHVDQMQNVEAVTVRELKEDLEEMAIEVPPSYWTRRWSTVLARAYAKKEYNDRRLQKWLRKVEYARGGKQSRPAPTEIEKPISKNSKANGSSC